jgi:hypothetical protein
MSVQERLEEALSQPVRSASDAERAARAAEALAQLLRATEMAQRALNEDSPEVDAERTVKGGELASLTLHEAAERVLEAAGVPLHVRELGKRIKAGGWRHPRSTRPRPDQIHYQLAARLPRHPQFRRVAPNTFGLSRWNDQEMRVGARRPTTGVFGGHGRVTGRTIGESPNEPIEGKSWRSS